MKSSFPKIVKVAPLTAVQLAVVFDDGAVVIADFRKAVKRGGIFSRLEDPDYFKRFKIIDGGRALAWPENLDICADVLYGPSRRTRHPRVTDFGVQILPSVSAAFVEASKTG